MKTKRELQFLTYLDALERGDAEGISAFLTLAEADAELEKMMMDYHTEASPEEKSKVISPFKRKREDANRWMQRFGNGLVAAVVMILVGATGVFIGARGVNGLLGDGRNSENPANTNNSIPTAIPADDTTNIFCTAEVANEDNTIMLLPDGDVNRSMTVGVNNPFVINSVTNRGIVGYGAFFEGLRVTIGINSIRLRGDCDSTSSTITVYPRDDASKSCVIEAESLTFPIVRGLVFNGNSFVGNYNEPYQQELVLLDAPVDGIYPIIDSQFDGGIPVEDIQVSAGCSSFPLLFIQPSVSASNLASETQVISITAFHVNEQGFEHGRMFYIPVTNQVLLACETGSWIALPPQAASQSDSRETPPEGFFEAEGNFRGIWQNILNTPMSMILTGNSEPTYNYCDLGWATSELMIYRAAYSYIPDANNVSPDIIPQGEHRFTSITGDVYIFNTFEASWRVEDLIADGRNSENPSNNDNPTIELTNVFCEAEITSEDNTIMLLAEGDIDRTLTVGVNNPFIVIPESGMDGGGWSGIFEGLRVTISHNSLNIPYGCERLSSITVYPKDNPERSCAIEIEKLRFPIERHMLSMESRGYEAYTERLVVLGAPVNGAYPIDDNLFEGSISEEFVSITGECTSFPMVYVQSSALAYGTPDDFTYPTIELSSIRVNEQLFEHGAMFYLEEMDEIWVACERVIEPWSPWMAWPSQMSVDISPSPRGNAPEGLFEPQGAFIAVWESMTSTELGGPICDLGWATGRMGTYFLAYDYEPDAQLHSITASTDAVYSFYTTEAGEYLWRVDGE